jgi:hypothetical protein
MIRPMSAATHSSAAEAVSDDAGVIVSTGYEPRSRASGP